MLQTRGGKTEMKDRVASEARWAAKSQGHIGSDAIEAAKRMKQLAVDVLNQGIKRSPLDSDDENLQTMDDSKELENITRQFQDTKDRYDSSFTLTHSLEES